MNPARHALLVAAWLAGVSPAHAATVVLLGVVATADPATSVAVFGGDARAHVRPGATVAGFRVDAVRPGGVELTRGDTRYWLRAGDMLDDAAPVAITSGLERHGDELRVTTALRDFLAGDGLVAVLMQACAEQVRGADGAVEGYELNEIDRGSAFDLAGLRDGDVVTEIDEIPATDPLTVLRVLAALRDKPDFTFAVRRAGSVVRTRVVVR